MLSDLKILLTLAPPRDMGMQHHTVKATLKSDNCVDTIKPTLGKASGSPVTEKFWKGRTPKCPSLELDVLVEGSAVTESWEWFGMLACSECKQKWHIDWGIVIPGIGYLLHPDHGACLALLYERTQAYPNSKGTTQYSQCWCYIS